MVVDGSIGGCIHGEFEQRPAKYFIPISFHALNSNQSKIDIAEMFIINTFGEQPTYIRFDDIYYSPQTSRVYLLHLPKWNMILTGSQNDAKINVLTADGTKETPRWMPHIFVSLKLASSEK